MAHKYKKIQEEIYHKTKEAKRSAINEILTKELTNSEALKKISIKNGVIYIDEHPTNYSEIEDSLNSDNPSSALSARQGKVLKQYVDNIMHILSSDDNNLDELQELVNFIKQNRDTLNSLTIDSIIGLRATLDSKADKSQLHNHNNKNILDNIGSNDGKLTYNGIEVSKNIVIYNSLDSNSKEFALSALQGKVLNDTKADKSELHSHINKDILDKISTRGKKLYFGSKVINIGLNVINSLKSKSSKNPLSARMGNYLNKIKADKTELHSHNNKDIIDKISAVGSKLYFNDNPVNTNVKVVDALNSDNKYDALSARQGRELNLKKADKSELPDMSQYVDNEAFDSAVNDLQKQISNTGVSLKYADTPNDLLLPNENVGDIVYVKSNNTLYINIKEPVVDSETNDVYQSFAGITLNRKLHKRFYDEINILTQEAIQEKLNNFNNCLYEINEDLHSSTKTYISDGGNDVYDNGNKIFVNGNPITYNDAKYKYFIDSNNRMMIYKFNTNDINSDTSEIRFEGNNGADGGGNLHTVTNRIEEINGSEYVLNGKGIQNAGRDPYIRHLLITNSKIESHTFATNTDNDNDVYVLKDNQPAILVIYWCETSCNENTICYSDFLRSIKEVAKMLLEQK